MEKVAEERTVIINCPTCEAKVSAKVVACKGFNDEMSGDTYFYSILECSVCRGPILSTSSSDVDFDENGDPMLVKSSETRIWPNPDRSIPFAAPDKVRSSLDEALKCLRARAYSACAVMCGKALEALCKEHSVDMRTLAQGLESLRSKGIIDGRLYEWGQALREARNLGAHVSDSEITKNDAADIFDFSIAIVDYVYVLNEKYEKFKKRRATMKESPKNG